MAELYVYTRDPDDTATKAVCAFLEGGSLAYDLVTVDPGSPVEAQFLKYAEEIDEPLPMVRIGEEIQATIFQPTTAVLGAFFPECGTGEGDLLEDADVTFFATNWCQDCWRVGQHLQKINADFTKIDIDSARGAPTSIMHWTGGRRVVPSLQIGETVRLFNPSMTLVSRLLGKER